MSRFGRFGSFPALGVATVVLSTIGAPRAGAQPTGWLPLQLIGYNADVIIDLDVNVRFAQLFDKSCCAWFESGAVDDGGMEHDDGIPAGSTFTSMTGSGVNYLIQPAVNNNVLQISNDVGAQAQGVLASGTLSLLNPEAYSMIAIFSSSGDSNPNAVGTVAINYDDGSSLTGTYNTFDWCGGSNPLAVIPANPVANLAVTAIGRVGSGITAAGTTKFSYDSGCGPQGFEAYETITPVDNTKNIVSFTFTAPTDGTVRSNIFGISALK
jgi:hypothetical protein